MSRPVRMATCHPDRRNYARGQCQRCWSKTYQRTPRSKDNYLRRKYGIDTEDYDRMFSDQGECCAICRQSQDGRKFDVDHDHSTGRVRGLLCNRCNQALGLLRDDLSIAQAVISYLLKHKTNAESETADQRPAT